MSIIEGMSFTVQSFCARYLPSLVRSMEPPKDRGSKEEERWLLRRTSLVQILFYLSFLPLWKGSFLRTCADAKDILLHIITYFLRLPPNLLRKPNIIETSLTIVQLHVDLIYNILLNVTEHGSASVVNLILPPATGASFLAACRYQLSSPMMVSPNPTQIRELKTYPPDIIARVKSRLQTLPMMLGIEGAGEVVLTRRVLQNTTSEGSLRCDISKKDDLVLEEGCLGGKDGTLMFCGVCKSVAYCSPEHQRLD